IFANPFKYGLSAFCEAASVLFSSKLADVGRIAVLLTRPPQEKTVTVRRIIPAQKPHLSSMSLDAHHFSVQSFILTCGCKIVKCFFCHPNDFIFYKLSPFYGSGFRMFDGAFPFKHRPSIEVILG